MSADRQNPEADGHHEGGVVTIVLRLLARRLAQGELVGRGEVVATGDVGEIKHADDLIRLASGNHATEGGAR
jgi:hypothetical protein